MDEIREDIKVLSLEAVRILSRMGCVRAAYLFGSQVEGNPGPWSDIDIAVFMEGIENWDIRQRAKAMGRVMIECGADMEAHLFPASVLANPPIGSFAAYILRHGAPLDFLTEEKP
ncbi:MAG: nucleotidyltransferase domain-containing protein [Candidatus Omnitrophota bacterium]